MVNIRNKYINKLYKRYDCDLWGKVGLMDKPSKYIDYIFDHYSRDFKIRRILRENVGFFLPVFQNQFLYKVSTADKEFKRKKRSIKITNYINRLKLKQFYGGIKLKQFKRDLLLLSNTSFIIGNSFFYFYESRLDVVLYRLNLFNSIYSSRQFILHKKVYVDGFPVNISSFKLSIGAVLTLSISKLNKLFYYNFLSNKLKNNKILSNYPAYFESDYISSNYILHKIPEINEVSYPFDINASLMFHNYIK